MGRWRVPGARTRTVDGVLNAGEVDCAFDVDGFSGVLAVAFFGFDFGFPFTFTRVTVSGDGESSTPSSMTRLM